MQVFCIYESITYNPQKIIHLLIFDGKVWLLTFEVWSWFPSVTLLNNQDGIMEHVYNKWDDRTMFIVLFFMFLCFPICYWTFVLIFVKMIWCMFLFKSVYIPYNFLTLSSIKAVPSVLAICGYRISKIVGRQYISSIFLQILVELRS